MQPNYTTHSPVIVNPKDNKDSDRLFAVDLSQGLKALRAIGRPGKRPAPSQRDESGPTIDRVRVAELLRAGGDSAAALRYELCHVDGAGWVGVCLANPNHDGLYHPLSCNDRACPVCSRRRSAVLAAEITSPILHLAQRAPRSYRLRHLVLTSDVSLFDDESAVRRCVQEWRVGIRLLLQDHFARRDANGRVIAKDAWLGGMIGVEFGESGRRLHFHILLLSRFVHMDSILARWRDLTGGRGFIGKVRQVDSDVAGAVDEVCKYATKALRFDGEESSVEETLARVHFVLKGTRRLQAFGTFYDMPRDKAESECNCPECGSPVKWVSELTWMESQAALLASQGAACVSSVLDLTPVNKLLPGLACTRDKPPGKWPQEAPGWALSS